MRTEVHRGGQSANGAIVFVAPVCGLYGHLRETFRLMCYAANARGYDAYSVEFSGQNGVPGLYSVSGSCHELRTLLHREEISESDGVYLFGICSGALACLSAANEIRRLCRVFCWEMSSFYPYRPASIYVLKRTFGVVFDPATALTPVQAPTLLPAVQAPIVLAMSGSSRATSLTEQKDLLGLAKYGRILELRGIGHFPLPDPERINAMVGAVLSP